MVERVTGYKFDKDGLHTIYKIEKTQALGANWAVRRSPLVEDVIESSRSRPHNEKKMEKFGRWIKAVGAESDQHVNICSFVVRCDQRWPSTQ